MTKIIVTEKALRELVSEVIGNPDARSEYDSLADEAEVPVNVNPVVDQSAAVTDPTNANFKPHSPAELQVAVKAMTDDLPKDQVPNVYNQFKGALDAAQDSQDKVAKDTMNIKNDEIKKVEEALRTKIRRSLIEMMSSTNEEIDPADAVADEEEQEHMPKRRGSYKSTAIGGMADVSGSSFEEIAKELGFSVAGAKQAVDKALLKAQFVAKMDPDDLEILTLTAMNDYINVLAKTGELSHADIQLMKDHPEIVRTLDGFREFLAKSVKRAKKAGGGMEESAKKKLNHKTLDENNHGVEEPGLPKRRALGKLYHPNGKPMIGSDFTKCPQCLGKKEYVLRGTHVSPCDFCYGIGNVEKLSGSHNENMTKEGRRHAKSKMEKCDQCGGRGEYYEKSGKLVSPCDVCDGYGEYEA